MRKTSNDISNERSFQLSRIYAAGWNAAKKLSSDLHAELNGDKIAALNPYKIDDERQRWADGFTAAAKR